jgi:pterin-4a-carbinolamine dehydratase
MMQRDSQGWQVTLADLALILFMTSATGLVEARRQGGETAGMALAQAVMSGEAVSIYRAGANAPEMSEWLASQGADPRQRLTIVARYLAGDLARAEADAARLARHAEQAGHNPRIIVEEGKRAELLAFFAYDANEEMAQTLQKKHLEKGPDLAAR